MADLVAIEIVGLSEIIAQAGNSGMLIGKPLRRFFTRAALPVERFGKELAPVDTGRLRASITSAVDSGALPLWAEIGPNVVYGASVEFGIGDFNEGPGGLGQAPLPTAAQLEGWARRKGINAAWAAERIQKKHGIEPNPYMTPGFAQAMPEIERALDQCGDDIEEQWRG